MLTPAQKFQAARETLKNALLERDEEIDLMLTCLLAGEHLCLVSPVPGLAKSHMLRALGGFLQASYFEYLLTKFTEPTELFGPISLSALRADRAELLTTGMLPDASVLFLDEIWKSSSAILNCLLGVLNERVFRYGRQVVPCRMELCLAAANEWPSAQEGSQEVGAIYDRFLVRKTVTPVTRDTSVEKLWWSSDEELTPVFKDEMTLSLDELGAARTEATRLTPTEEAAEVMRVIRKELNDANIRVGDRRARKSAKLVRAAAWLEGASQIEPAHLDVLQHCLWEDPIEQPRIAAQVVMRHANPSGLKLVEIMTAVESLTVDRSSFSALLGGINKLEALEKQLKTLPESPRVKSSLKYVGQKLMPLKKRSLELRG